MVHQSLSQRVLYDPAEEKPRLEPRTSGSGTILMARCCLQLPVHMKVQTKFITTDKTQLYEHVLATSPRRCRSFRLRTSHFDPLKSKYASNYCLVVPPEISGRLSARQRGLTRIIEISRHHARIIHPHSTHDTFAPVCAASAAATGLDLAQIRGT